MSTFGFFGVHGDQPKDQHDRSYTKVLSELIGPGHTLKAAITECGIEYFTTFANKARLADLDAAIITDERLLNLVVKSLPDFKPSYDKRGVERNLTLNDYHGSFFRLPGSRISRDRGLDILVLNPLEHTRTVPEGRFIFKRFISKLTKPDSWFPQTPFTWELATAESIDGLYEKFQEARLIAVDIETDKDSPLRTMNCVGYCALWPDGSTHTIVIPTIDMWGIHWMRKFNGLPAPKLMQGGQYDAVYFMRYGAPLDNWLWDTQNLFHSWYAELPKRLDYITAFALREVRFWKDDGKSGNLYDHYEYNARDCWATLNSLLSLMREIPDWGIKNYLIEFPLVFPCLHCELDGLAVNKAQFDISKAEVEAKLQPLEEQFQRWIPGANPGSPDQMKRLLKVLGCADKDGNVKSSDEPALKAAASLHPLNERIISVLLDIRGYRKLISTYLDWDKFWNGRLHYRLNPAGTDTARLASTESSYWTGLQIQNIPARDGPAIKMFIERDEGWDGLAEGDYAQSEARCVGYISGCTSLINLVEGPHDYHSWNASAFFGIPYESIYDERTKETLNKSLRDLSKRTNHGANYNMGPAVMLQTMGPKAVAEAKRLLKLPATMSLIDVCAYLLKAYENTYPEVKRDLQQWIIRTIAFTKKLTSALGWTRYFFADPKSSKPALNAAVAHGPQNLSVGIINEVFYNIWRRSVYGDLRDIVRVKAQIHDSIPFCYRGANTPRLVQDAMVNPVQVTDIQGVTRTLRIPVDMSYLNKKTKQPARFWSELK